MFLRGEKHAWSRMGIGVSMLRDIRFDFTLVRDESCVHQDIEDECEGPHCYVKCDRWRTRACYDCWIRWPYNLLMSKDWHLEGDSLTGLQ